MAGLFLVAAAAFVIRDDGCFLFLRRSTRADYAPGEWDTPNGRLQAGETVLAALHREVIEETGLAIVSIRPVDTWRILRGAEQQEMIGITYLCRCTGDAEVRLSGEHDAYQWVRPEDAREFPAAVVFRDALLRVIDEIGAAPTRNRGSKMAVLDDIAAERQRLTERLERIDAERQKLADQIAELDAAERVLSRLTPMPTRGQRRRSRAQQADETAPTPARGGRRRAQTTADATETPQKGRRRGAGRGGRPKRQRPEVPLGDATLRAIEVVGSGVSAEQIREYLGRELSMQVRPNHLGMALQRHRRAGRLQEEDGRWSMAQEPAGGEPAP